jgi:hypothetical protein
LFVADRVDVHLGGSIYAQIFVRVVNPIPGFARDLPPPAGLRRHYIAQVALNSWQLLFHQYQGADYSALQFCLSIDNLGFLKADNGTRRHEVGFCSTYVKVCFW